MKKLGLVFSGGGGKGAYEIGVWKALREYGMDKGVEAVAGTSVGALNSALFAQGDFEASEDLWTNISPSQIMKFNREQAASAAAAIAIRGIPGGAILAAVELASGGGLFNQEGLKQLIDKSNATYSINKESLPLYACALNAGSGELEYPQLNSCPPGEMSKWLMASSAIPLVFDAVSINDATYVDGGVLPGDYSDNTPCRVLIEKEHCTHIINVFLDRTPDVVDPKAKYPGVKFWNIVPTQAFDGIIGALNFTSENAIKLINCGYQDVKAILEQFQKFQETEERFMEAVFDFGQSDKTFKESILTNQYVREKPADTPDFMDVMTELAETITRQEKEIIDSGVEDLLEDMKTNSDDLLDDAFTAITTLASTEGRINAQMEQGHISRFFGAITGKNSRVQAQLNWDLNRSIYATQMLVHQLSEKCMLTMEAVVALSNKTNYLMSHVNVLYGSVKILENKQLASMTLMQQGMESLAQKCWQKFSEHSGRLEGLERHHHIDNWYHSAKSHFSIESESPEKTLLTLTASFYNASGRQWDDFELHRYMNVVSENRSLQKPVKPIDILQPSLVDHWFQDVSASDVLPVRSDHEACHPLLKSMQLVSEGSAESISKHLERDHFSLEGECNALDIGFELLYSLRRNDRREPQKITTQTLLENLSNAKTGVQANYLDGIDALLEVESELQLNSTVQEDLRYLRDAIRQFKIVIPIIGKFSSGKSTLLNRYLDKNYLECDLTPETAFATELHYSPDEYLLLHFLDDRPAERKPLEYLANIEQEDGLYYVQAFINNKKLANRDDMVLVDMPGFDSTNNAHHKATACYLEKGDCFINLMPVDIPYDSTVIDHLVEIRYDFGKDVFCLLSKASKVLPEKVESNRKALMSTLKDKLSEPISVGVVDAIDGNLADFEDYLDRMVCDYDDLLAQRYQQSLRQCIANLSQEIITLKTCATADKGELSVRIAETSNAADHARDTLQRQIKEMRFNLCSEGAEQLVAAARSALMGAHGQLVRAAETNNTQQVMIGILRPVVQSRMNQLIDAEISRLETDMKIASTADAGSIHINLSLPASEKEKFSILSATLSAGLGLLVMNPILAGIVGLIAGFLGRKDNAQERQRMIEDKISNEVIPQAVSQVVQIITLEMEKTVNQLEQHLMSQVSQEEENISQQLQNLQRQLEEKQSDFDDQQQVFEAALDRIQTVSDSLNVAALHSA